MAQDVDITLRLKGVDKVKSGTEDNKKALADRLGSAVDGLTDAFDKMTGGAVSGFERQQAGQDIHQRTEADQSRRHCHGIGALVVGVTALVAAFTKTRKGARMLKVAFFPSEQLLNKSQHDSKHSVDS